MAGQIWEVTGGADKGGILVRAGASTKSPELPARLGTGALVRQLELQGDRLRYFRLTGEGPRCGWVSTKLKDKSLLVQSDRGPPADEAGGYGPEMLERPFSIIVYGATGYTGDLICQHLDYMLSRPGSSSHRWAVAGRNAERLRELQAKLRTRPDVLVAESEEQIADVAGQCRVLLSAAGPYALCGEAVVRACVASGTDYVDITGEAYWVRQMIDRYDVAAKEKSVAVISMSGQDSVPPDVAVNLLVQHLGPLKQVRAYMFAAGGMSGGTAFTGLTSWRTNPELAFAAQQDPFHIGGIRRGAARPIDQECTIPEQCPLFPRLWLGPAGTGQPDSRCVRRSCGLFDESGDGLRYGDDFALVYRDATLLQKSAADMLRMCGPVPSASFAPKVCEMMQDQVNNKQAPSPGGGAPAETRQHYYSTLVAVAEAEDGRWAHCELRAPEAYEVTAVCSVAAALAVCEERSALQAMGRGGLMTPAFALLGTTFMERLRGSPFADGEAQRAISWQVKDGKPTEEYMVEAINRRGKAMGEVFDKFQQGELQPF